MVLSKWTHNWRSFHIPKQRVQWIPPQFQQRQWGSPQELHSVLFQWGPSSQKVPPSSVLGPIPKCGFEKKQNTLACYGHSLIWLDHFLHKNEDMYSFFASFFMNKLTFKCNLNCFTKSLIFLSLTGSEHSLHGAASKALTL